MLTEDNPCMQRQKWGLLEKHKDYTLRAQDHRLKRKRIKTLREKARDRNPDEFHFGMMSTRTSKGVKLGDRGNRALDQEVVMLLKTQDVGYVRTVLQRTRREIAKLECGLMVEGGMGGGEGEGEGEGMGLGKMGKEGEIRIVGGLKGVGRRRAFVDSVDQQKGEWERRGGSEVRGYADTGDGEDDDGVWLDEEEDAALDDGGENGGSDQREMENEDERARREAFDQRTRKLAALRRREEKLRAAEEELEYTRAKMSNSIGGINKNGVKYKVKERKR